MYNNSIKISIIGVICLILAGCLSFGPLKYKQVKMLQKEGFVQTDEGWTLGLPERLLFEFDKSEVNPAHQQEIIRLANQLNKYGLHKLKVVGYTDNIGNRDYNLKLSKARAQSVASIFMNNGFVSNNIQIIGRGADQPLLPNTTEENRAANRRVAIVIVP